MRHFSQQLFAQRAINCLTLTTRRMPIKVSSRQLYSAVCLVTAVGLFALIILSVGQQPANRFKVRRRATANACLVELLNEFGIHESSLDLSVPIYARHSRPKPISKVCQRAGIFFANYSDDKVAKAAFSNLKLLKYSDQTQIYEIAQQLYSNFSQLGLELFLIGGSLLGSVRHLGFIPWDADVDFMIPVSQKPAAKRLLMELSRSSHYRFVDTESSNQHWQLGILCQLVTEPVGPEFGQNQSRRRQFYVKRWLRKRQQKSTKSCKTIVDFFFGEVKNKLYSRQEWPYSFPLQMVYPLGVRPFGPHLLPVPNQPVQFLAHVYGKYFEATCVFKYFENKEIPCSELTSHYPFVKHLQLARSNSSALIRADLLINNSQMVALFIPKQ